MTINSALSILSANDKTLQNAEYVEGRALVATWLNYLAGNPITASDTSVVDAKDAIQWGVDWLLKVNGLNPNSAGSDTLSPALFDSLGSPAKTSASSAAWNVGIDGVNDANTTPTAYPSVPLYVAGNDIPGGVQILGILDEYNNHGTVYGVQIATV